MKRKGKVLFFWSGLALMAGVFLLVALWSIFPFGGKTLPHFLEQIWNLTFHFSALIVSLACGLLAVGTMSLTWLAPCPETMNQSGALK